MGHYYRLTAAERDAKGLPYQAGYRSIQESFHCLYPDLLVRIEQDLDLAAKYEVRQRVSVGGHLHNGNMYGGHLHMWHSYAGDIENLRRRPKVFKDISSARTVLVGDCLDNLGEPLVLTGAQLLEGLAWAATMVGFGYDVVDAEKGYKPSAPFTWEKL